MSWSVNAMADGVPNMLPDARLLAQWLPTAALVQQFLISLAIFAAAAWILTRTSFGQQVSKKARETIFTNWRLALLAATAIVLSLASGWTTWDGMRNFTSVPLLSLMITFGIQGVMLIVAWLIGESFAAGMSGVPGHGPAKRAAPVLIAACILAAALLALAALLYLVRYGMSADGWIYILGAAGLSLLAIALLTHFSDSDLLAPYVQALRITAKSAVLWVMFLACMATSVFFSFDSLFSAIFPQEERKRAAQIRTVNQVAGVVTDIGVLAEKRRMEEVEALFASPGWAAYERELDKVAALANRAPRLIREEIERELYEQKSRVAELEERRANAQGAQAGLLTRKTQLSEQLARLASERPEAAARTQEQAAVVGEIEKRLDEQRAKTLAEEKGVEGSLKVGRGRFWRAARAEEDKLQAELEVARERLRGHEGRLGSIDRRMAAFKTEMAQIEADLAKLTGVAETAAQMIAATQSLSKTGNDHRLDPAAAVASLEGERQLFRQKPEQAGLANIRSRCAMLQAAGAKVPSLQDEAAAIDCDPRQAGETAGRIFALNASMEHFARNCSGGDKLPATEDTGRLLEFGRKCLQDSGLPSQDAAAMGALLSAIDLNRDDKAHRFVVTWNAFQDGNRLAYLALAIAIAIDSLIFMSGVFGANAVRSPLSDVPGLRARTAQQLEAVVQNALLPDKFENAQLVLEAMHPVTPRNGFTMEVFVPPDETPNERRILKVLNAGASIGAVHRDDDQPGRYLVRAELFEFLSIVSEEEFEADERYADLVELEKIVRIALLPNVAEAVDAVLHHMHPMNETDGFTSEIFLNDVEPRFVRPVRNVLNAGATLQMVERDANDSGRYRVHADLFRTLARIRERLLGSNGSVLPQLGGPSELRNLAFGGDLTQRLPAVAEAIGAERLLPPQAPARTELAVGELRSQLLGELLAAINVGAETFRHLETPLVALAAIDVGNRLKRQTQQHGALHERLRLADSAMRSKLEQAYRQIFNRRPHDVARTSVLDAALSDIVQRLPALSLAPETGLIKAMIDELCAGASDDGLAPPDEKLLELLRRLRDDLTAMNWSDASAWNGLRAMVEPHASEMGSGSLAARDTAASRSSVR